MNEAERPSLLFVNQFYYPDVAATGQHLTDLAEYLAAREFGVTVYTALATYTGDGAPSIRSNDRRNGVRIRRFRSTTFGRASHAGRIVDYASFYLQVLLAILFGRRFDGVVFLTTPPLIPAVGLVARALRGQRYAIWSMDLHPAAEFAAGMLRLESMLGQLLGWIWRAAHRRADFVVALGQFMRARIVDEGINAARVTAIPPWSSAEDFSATEADVARHRHQLQIGNRFVVMYSGNAGLVHDFDAICSAMRILKDDDRIFFLFVGSGPRRREIEAFVSTERLGNVAFQDYVDRDSIGISIASAEAHLISLRAEFAGVAVPSKLYGIMAAGRPALFVGPVASEPADTILRADCGAVVDPASGGDGSEVADTIVRWLSNPGERLRLGANARQAFLRDYESSTGCARFMATIDEHWRRDRRAMESSGSRRRGSTAT